jgi:hypothetical protein
MSDEELAPLDPDLARLVRAERAEPGAPAGSKARVLTRLAASIGTGGGGDGGDGGDTGDGGSGSGPSGPSAAVTPLARALPLLAAFVVGGAVGAGVMAARPPSIVYVDRVVPTTTPPGTPTGPETVTETAIGLPPTVVATGSTVSSAPAASSTESPDATLARERAILDVARTAVGRGDAPHALEAVEHHQREFPHGQLVEEREAIAIQALARLARFDEAHARASRFHRRYPHSVLLPVVDAAVESARQLRDGGGE